MRMVPRSDRQKLFVVYWNNIPSPYMVDRFNALADRGEFEFEAWFNDKIEPDRSWKVEEENWRFKYRYIPSMKVAGRTWHFPLLLLKRRPDVLVSLYAAPSFALGWAVAKLRGTKTVFRVLMTHDRWVRRHPWKEWAKRFLFRFVDAVETPGEDGKRFAMRYGVPEGRVYLATHTVDIPHFVKGVGESRARRDALRAELGLHGVTFLYVGRLWWGKGVDFLIEAFSDAQGRSRQELSLLLVGDGVDEERLRELCSKRKIRNVVFAGFKQREELPKYFGVSDVFVFPTLGDPYGLVVDEAMACSLPVISTSAAGEIRSRVREGVNGVIVPPEDSLAMADKMLELAGDAEQRGRMGVASSVIVAGHTPERWAEHFERLVWHLLETERAGS
jgi:glycosyltransferase involved in cell wall biosynthesis